MVLQLFHFVVWKRKTWNDNNKALRVAVYSSILNAVKMRSLSKNRVETKYYE